MQQEVLSEDDFMESFEFVMESMGVDYDHQQIIEAYQNTFNITEKQAIKKLNQIRKQERPLFRINQSAETIGRLYN